MSASAHHCASTPAKDTHAHTGGMVADGCCAAHAAATVPASMIQHMLHAQPDSAGWQARREVAPQPDYEPPLRPPLA
jgi:hypothetical protein